MLASLGFAAALLAATGTQTSSTVKYAVVIGSNHPLPDSNYAILQYADDDAVRFTEYFGEIGVDATLLTTPDAETMRRYPSFASRARRPTVAELDRVLTELRGKLEKAEGLHRELFFVFSGHGSITSSEAYLHLFDGRFTRTDLFERILKQMPAERVHVIIDSCHSYFLVNSRGERVAVATDEESLDRYPWAGFLVSTSERQEVQEWSGYEAGVFSYQVLGALRGAADVDGDGVVTYAEAHAYVVAANYAVETPEARIKPYVRRPASDDRAIVNLRALPRERKTRIPEAVAGHFHVMDGRRGRVLDANKPRGHSLVVVLPEGGPHVVVRGEERYFVDASAGEPVLVAAAPGDPLILASKGSIADELRTHLFEIPLSMDFVRGIDAASPQITRLYVKESAVGPWHSDPITLSMLGAGAAGTIVGLISTNVFTNARNEANRNPPDVEAARGRAEDYRAVMITSYAVGGAFLVAGIVRAIVTNEPDNIRAEVKF